MSGVRVERAQLGGMTARERPTFGPRPAVRFAFAVSATVLYIGFAVVVSAPWRSDLKAAIGPVAAWGIPILLAYIPGTLIGFLFFTLLFTRYRAPALDAPRGPWPAGEWAPITVIVAAYNEQDGIVNTARARRGVGLRRTGRDHPADNNSTDRTAELAAAAAERLGLDYRCVFEPLAGKHHAHNTALVDVTTPLARLFPGRTQVDWLAVDGYNWGATRSWGWQSYADIFAPTVAALHRLAPKPVMIAETGAAPDARKPAWAADTLRHAQADGVRAVVWFEFDKETDWRLSESPAVADAARDVLRSRTWRKGGNLPAVERAVRG